MSQRDPWDDDVPPKRKQKPPISYRFSDEVVDFFKADGPGWQSRMHVVLFNHMKRVKRQREEGRKP